MCEFSRRLLVTISDEASLLSAVDYIHDGWFCRDDMAYDAPGRVFRLAVCCETDEAVQRKRVAPFLYRVGYRQAKRLLEIYEVVDARLRFTDPSMDCYLLNTIAYEPNKRTVRFYVAGAVDIRLCVTSLSAKLYSSDEVSPEDPAWRWALKVRG